MKQKTATIALLFITIFLFIFPSSVKATEFGLAPAHPNLKDKTSFSQLQYTAEAGSSVVDEIAVINLTNNPLSLNLFVDDSLSPALIKLVENTIKLEPKKRTTIPFTLTIPKNIKQGEYLLYIYASTDEKAIRSKKTPYVKITAQVGKQKIYNIQIESLETKTTSDGIVLTTKLKNTGNVSINSLGFDLALKNNLPFNADTNFFWGEDKLIAPGQTVEFSHTLTNNLPLLGNLQGTLSVNFDVARQSIKDNFTLFYIATKQLLMMGGFIAIVIAALIFIKKLSLFQYITLPLRAVRLIAFKKNPPKNTKKPPAQSPNTAQPENSEQKLNGLINNIIHQETASEGAQQQINYEKILFEVRKIVRQEIELWHEMERFKKNIRKELNEEVIKQRLQSLHDSNTKN